MIPRALLRASGLLTRLFTAGAIDLRPNERNAWPPLDPGPHPARIDAPTAAQRLQAVPYSPDPAVCEAAVEEWVGPPPASYTAPDPADVDPAAVSIPGWDHPDRPGLGCDR